MTAANTRTVQLRPRRKLQQPAGREAGWVDRREGAKGLISVDPPMGPLPGPFQIQRRSSTECGVEKTRQEALPWREAICVAWFLPSCSKTVRLGHGWRARRRAPVGGTVDLSMRLPRTTSRERSLKSVRSRTSGKLGGAVESLRRGPRGLRGGVPGCLSGHLGAVF